MKLQKLFAKKLVTAGPSETVASVALQMQEHNVGAVIIVENHRPVGIVTDRDLALALGAQGISPQAAVERVMTGRVRTVSEDAGVFAATKAMRDYEVRRLPIVDQQDRLVGIVTLDDLMRFLASELHNLAEGIKHEVEVR
jgi:CBS domain-containing protein